MSLEIFARQSLAQFAIIYGEIFKLNEGKAINPSEIETLMWGRMCAKEANINKLGFKVPYDNIRRSKVTLPYLPHDINYTGCPVIKKNGGLYTPCCGKIAEDALYCKTCSVEKDGKAKELEFGTMDTRDAGVEDELFAPITFGEWMKAHKMTLTEVYAKLAAAGVSVEIPAEQLICRELPKRRKGRPAKSDDSVIDEDTVKPKRKAKKADSDSEEKPKKVKAKASPATSESETEKPKKAAKKVPEPESESEEEAPPKKKASPKASPAASESETEKPKKKVTKPKEPEPESESEEEAPAPKKTEKPKKDAKAEKPAKEPKVEKPAKEPKVEKPAKEPKAEKKDAKAEKAKEEKPKKKVEPEPEELDVDQLAAGFAEDEDNDDVEATIDDVDYIIRNGKFVCSIEDGTILGTVDGDEVVWNSEKR